MMTHTELHDAIERSAHIAQIGFRAWLDGCNRGVHDTGTYNSVLIERGRLAGLIWAAVGITHPARRDDMLFPTATELARRVAVDEITVEHLLANPLLILGLAPAFDPPDDPPDEQEEPEPLCDCEDCDADRLRPDDGENSPRTRPGVRP